MVEEKTAPTDVLGVKPWGDAALKLVDGAGTFLGKLCLPAAEEFGLLLKDRVRYWRAANALNMAVKAEKLYTERFPDESAHAHPRLAMQVIEHASWAEEDDVQALWAGLLVSSCSPDGRDDSNLMFVDLLAKLSTPQARLLEHVSVACPKVCSKSGFVVARRTHLSLAEVKRVMRVDDIHRIDRELDHLRAIGLLEDGSGFLFDEMAGTTFEATPEAQVPLGPTALALQMHARVHGAANPLTFFGLKVGHGMMGGDGDA